MSKDDALVNLWLVFPVHQSEGLYRPLALIDLREQVCLEISESIKPSAETRIGTAVRPEGLRTIKCNRMDSNFISNRCYFFQNCSFPLNRNLCPGCCYSRCHNLGLDQRFSIQVMNHYNFISRTLIGCSGSILLQHIHSQLETSFQAQSSRFHIRNHRFRIL